MSKIEDVATSLLDSLRDYPRWLVIVCLVLVVGGLLAMVLKPVKWAFRLGLLAVVAALVVVVVRWQGR